MAIIGILIIPHFPLPLVISAPAESTQKPSSLRSKVKERQERQRERERMLSELTAPTVPVENETQLRAAAGKNTWSVALVNMLQASTNPRMGQAERERLMNVSYCTVFWR